MLCTYKIVTFLRRNRLDFFIFKPHRLIRKCTFKIDQRETKWFDKVNNCIDNPNRSDESPEWSIACDSHSLRVRLLSINNTRELESVQTLIWLFSCLKYIDKASHLTLKNDAFPLKSLTF